MKRRDFIKRSGALALPLMIGGYSVKALGRTPLLDALAAGGSASDRVFVLIQLSGGNDGLNTVIPLDQYGAYRNARSNIAIGESAALKLNAATGLNPAMTGMQALYGEGKVRLVQAVGYPTPNYSHFRSTDIWLTASDTYDVLTTGWMGRYLAEEYPGFPVGYPNAAMPDPLAIQIGSSVTTALEGPGANMGMAFSNPSAFYNIVSGTSEPVPSTRAGHELAYIRSIGQQIETFAATVKAAATKAKNLSTLWPTARQNPLADQLKIVSLLIAGGLKTRVYVVNLGGFDTHSAQVAPHGALLGQLSSSIQAFQDDLRLLGVEDRVVGMTFSEFGRRIKSNASGGTDHGAAAPLFVFGTNVIPGVLGTSPIIPTSVTEDDNVPMQYDFRSIYASILKDWFGVSQTILTNVLYKDFQILPIIKGGTPSVVASEGGTAAGMLIGNRPNPFFGSTRIAFRGNGDHLQIRVFDRTGKEVRRLVDGRIGAGEHETTFDANDLPAGVYYCRLECGGHQEMREMVLAK